MDYIEQTNDYWIIDNKIIFKHEFNKSIDSYIGLINKYDELVFSNYDDVRITLETNNLYCKRMRIKWSQDGL